MVRVPTYDGQQVQPEALPGVGERAQASPDAFGGALASTAQQTGARVSTQAAEIIDRERRKADEVAVQDAQAKLNAWENQALYDPQSGALTKRGQDAFGLPQQVMDDYAKTSSDITAGLTSDDQRRAFHGYAQAKQSDVQRTLYRHVDAETQAYDKQSFQSLLDTSHEAALANYTDEARVGQEINRQLDAIDGFSRRNGLPPEWRDQAAQNATSGTLTGVIGRMVDSGQDLAAKDFYDHWQDHLTGTDQDHVSKLLKEGSSRGASRQIADEITGPGGATTLASALDDLEKRKVSNTDVYDQTKSRLRDHFKLAEEAQQEHDQQAFDRASGLIDQASGDWTKVDPSTWQALPLHMKSTLRSYAEQVQSGNRPSDYTDQYFKLRDQATQDPGAFATTDLRPYVPTLSPKRYGELTDAQQKIKEGQASPSKLVEWSLVDRVSKRALEGLNLPTGSGEYVDQDQLKVANSFRAQLDKAVTSNAAITGKQPGEQEVQKIADELSMQVAVTKKGSLYGTNTTQTPAFQAPGAPRLAFRLEDVPAAKRIDLANRLRIGGLGSAAKPITADMIVHAYNVETAGTSAADAPGD